MQPEPVAQRPSLAGAIALLASAQLPTEDLSDAHCEHFFFTGPREAPTSLVGVELFDGVALLRSLVVSEKARGAGAGSVLLRHAEEYARQRGVRTIYLLTTTAENFFLRRGFARTDRASAPLAIRTTREFAGICPASSAFMSKTLSFNVLILCTGNSARSILAESLINFWGRGEFVGFSAGSSPKGTVHPIALELLKEMKMPAEGMRSKSWDEFAEPGAPQLDFVFTVCDNAAGEMCPVWPGKPMTAHWGVPDPAAVEGTEADRRLAFQRAYRELESRIKIFTSLPIRSLDRAQLQDRLREIGKTCAASY